MTRYDSNAVAGTGADQWPRSLNRGLDTRSIRARRDSYRDRHGERADENSFGVHLRTLAASSGSTTVQHDRLRMIGRGVVAIRWAWRNVGISEYADVWNWSNINQSYIA